MTNHSGAHELKLRPAVETDAYMLWLWANDVQTRLASLRRDEIEWDTHVTWFGSRIRRDDHLILIATTGADQPVGVTRFDSEDGWQTARLSYVIAPEQRNRGLAAALVSAGTGNLREIHRSVAIRADVEPDNDRSLRVFRSAGWTETANRDRAGALTFWYY